MKSRAPLTFRGVVYSTGQGRMCPACGQPLAQCACGREPARPAGDGIVRVSRQVQGRKGKGVTVITGVPLAGDALQVLATQLKQRCGSGGTVRDGVIEVQGDHRDVIVGELQGRGWTVKRSGG
jgi:translation initiation factor 1